MAGVLSEVGACDVRGELGEQVVMGAGHRSRLPLQLVELVVGERVDPGDPAPVFGLFLVAQLLVASRVRARRATPGQLRSLALDT
ncbi:hypothetical protein [Streptomyces nigrescens]